MMLVLTILAVIAAVIVFGVVCWGVLYMLAASMKD